MVRANDRRVFGYPNIGGQVQELLGIVKVWMESRRITFVCGYQSGLSARSAVVSSDYDAGAGRSFFEQSTSIFLASKIVVI